MAVLGSSLLQNILDKRNAIPIITAIAKITPDVMYTSVGSISKNSSVLLVENVDPRIASRENNNKKSI